MNRQYNITQTSLQMEKKIITANSFHETSITLTPSPQKKKKDNVKKENYWQISLMNLGSPTNTGSLKPAIYKRQSSWLHFLGYSLSCCNQKNLQTQWLKEDEVYFSLTSRCEWFKSTISHTSRIAAVFLSILPVQWRGKKHVQDTWHSLQGDGNTHCTPFIPFSSKCNYRTTSCCRGHWEMRTSAGYTWGWLHILELCS